MMFSVFPSKTKHKIINSQHKNQQKTRATGTVSATGVDTFVHPRNSRPDLRFQAIIDGITKKAEVAAGVEPADERELAGRGNMAIGTVLERYARAMYAGRIGARLQATSTDGPIARTSTGALAPSDPLEPPTTPVVLASAGYAPLVPNALAPLFDETIRCPLVTSPDALVYFPPGTPAFPDDAIVAPLTGGHRFDPRGRRFVLLETGVAEFKCRRSPAGSDSIPALANPNRVPAAGLPLGALAGDIRAAETNYETRIAMQVFIQTLASAIALGLIGRAHAESTDDTPCVVALDSGRLYLPLQIPDNMATPLRRTADARQPQFVVIRMFLLPGAKELVGLVMEAISEYVDYVRAVHAVWVSTRLHCVDILMSERYKQVIARLNDASDPAWKEVMAVKLGGAFLSEDDVRAALAV